MAITVKHTKVSTIPDDADTSLVRPSDWNADHTLVGLGTMAEQNANAVAITGGTITGVSGLGDVVGPASSTDNAVARFDSTTGKLLQNSVVTIGDTGATTGITTLAASTSVTTPIIQATNSAGLSLKNSAGTTQISMGAGGGDNASINVSTNINGTNAQIDISPTGTGHVHINPTGVNSIQINPTYVGTMDNMTIGATTPKNGSFVDLSVTGTTSFDGSQGTAGQVLTSAGTGATPTWTTPTTGTVTSVATAGTVNGLTLTGGPITSTGTVILGGTLDLSSPPTIGNTAPNTGAFTTLGSTGTATLASGSTTYVTITGDASYPMIKATGGTNTPLVLSPLGTGALQAQKTDSTATGGNARGSQAVDWQTLRASASQVASGFGSFCGGGASNTANTSYATAAGGNQNVASGTYAFLGGGLLNVASGYSSVTVGGVSNTSAGYFNFVGGGFTNSGTALAAVTTQSGTMNATTAVTLSGSNANIKVGQYITGTSIATNTYVAAISGTSLTLSQAASGSSTSTLSFYTPHGVVVGGGNNQATGSYSFIGGGGDAGTSTNRNVASGDWSVVAGGLKNTASGNGSFVGAGGLNSSSASNPNTASGLAASVVSGNNNQATAAYAFVGAGTGNLANAQLSAIIGGQSGTTRGISGNSVFPACNSPISSSSGVSQSALLILGRQTTDATATVLTCDSSAASTTNQVILPNNSAYYFKGSVIAGVTGAGDTKGWSIEGAIKRGAGVGTAVLVGTPTVTSLYADAGASTWTVTALADTTNGGLKITVTGQASTTIRWVAKIETTEMTY